MNTKHAATLILALVVAGALQAAAWIADHQSIAPPDVKADLASVSYQSGAPGKSPTRAELARDLDVVSDVAGGIRLYSATGGMEQVPVLAAENGMAVTAGAWIDKDEARNAREIAAVTQLAKANRNVDSVMVGNEAVLRKDVSADRMADLIRQVKHKVRRPVSTGEAWHVWRDHPELVKAVDFIAVHLLPYWEGVPADKAVDYAFQRYDELHALYPNKRIVIAEFGWPSQGYNRNAARTGALIQAQVVRQFVTEANRRHVPYNLVEAIDQPWKTNEGSVGAHWGLFDAERHAKFSLTGLVTETRDVPKGLIALLLGAAVTVAGLRRRNPTLGHALFYAVAANAMAAGVVLAAAFPAENYLTAGGWITWGMGFTAMLPLVAITLSKVHEIAAVLFGRRPLRLIQASPIKGPTPKVSIHIPAYREKPELLKATLDSVAALDYPDFEALVIVNNTPEEAYWRPVAEHCALLGPRFKFVFLPKVAGFKAGAMNEALRFMAPDAEIIAVIDADYVVHPDWLKDLVPAFADPRVGLVQAPQDHRDGSQSLLKRMMNWEYAGFFDIGMVQRNEDNAIVAHGTMLMVRRRAFEEAGGWSTGTIVEDTELGLRLFEMGWTAHYTNTRYGWGVLPDSFKAYMTQRHRWAYGAIQIIKAHWRHMLPGVNTLTRQQKGQFVTGWFYWLSDALGALVAMMNLLWVPMILLVGVMIPAVPMTVPILAAFAVNLLHCLLLYRRRVRGAGLVDTMGAAVAAMSLQLTVAKAVYDGVVKDGLPFKRTEKGGNSARRKGERVAALETLIGLSLALAALLLWWTNSLQITELTVFAVTLGVQSLPFLAASLMRGIEMMSASRLGTGKNYVPQPSLGPGAEAA